MPVDACCKKIYPLLAFFYISYHKIILKKFRFLISLLKKKEIVFIVGSRDSCTGVKPIQMHSFLSQKIGLNFADSFLFRDYENAANVL